MNQMQAKTAYAVGMSAYMSKVYLWMTAGLLVTAIVALAVASSALFVSLASSGIILGLCIAEVVLVIVLSSAIHRMSAQTATLLFMLYACLNGVTLSVIFAVYTTASIANAFFTTAGTFLAMSVYGATTKRDLTGLGSFLFMGLIGLIIASIVNIFLASSTMDFVVSAIGVLIFTLFTAYDTQKLRQFGQGAPLDDAVALQRGAILGALTLYLDFINLFIQLLHLFGGNRD